MTRKKHFFYKIFILLSLLIFALPASAALDIGVTIDNAAVSFDVPPTIINGRTLVPLRGIFESLGADIQWDAATQTITGVRGGTTISLQVDNPTAYKNGQALSLDVPATILEARTLVPTRFIAEALGAQVNWNDSNRSVEIISGLPYDLAVYYVLENNIKQQTMQLDEPFYEEFETVISSHFKLDTYTLMEAYLTRTYPATKTSSGSFIGPPPLGRTQGVYQSANGGKYVGDLLNGNLDGKGIYYYSDGGRYMGEWQRNKRSGWGILYTATGDVFIGDWSNDTKEGRGIYRWSSGETYWGQWSVDKRQGLGYYTWPDGKKYTGLTWADEITGSGIFIWPDGRKYLGEYINGQKHGQGSYYWRPDFAYLGQFANDQRTWGTYQGPEQLFNLRENAESIINKVITPEMNSQDKVKALHDYVVLATGYDKESVEMNNIPAEAHTAYGAFVNKKAVCDGYTEALNSLLQTAGIESIFVQGEAKSKDTWEGHAWLIVKLDGEYSHLDVTWNDPDQGDTVKYDYFLVSDEKMATDHRWEKAAYPTCP